MTRSTDRILTTHCGSLARPHDLLDLMKAKVTGQPCDDDTYVRRVRSAVAEVVRRQIESGIDIPTDGEQGKPGFFAYVDERLAGFEARRGASSPGWAAEVAAFPEYYQEYFSHAMAGGAIAGGVKLTCTGPVSYRGHQAVRRDIDNLTAALAGLAPADVFMPAVAPSGVGANEYYRTDEEYLHAVAEAMHTEYRAIVDAGFLLQIDDHGLRGIAPERVRFHTCYGINEGPRVHDAPLRDVLDVMVKVHAGAYAFEAANARHEHEYHVFEEIKMPEDKVLIPGVITHASNIVEHPELVAERIIRFARLVGRENVIAGTDCGFSSQATYHPEVHPSVVWAKFRAMADGARLATTQLWR